MLDFIGTHTFEELCRDWLGDVAEMGELPFRPERTGSFWSRQAQVDLVAINWRSKDILLGECKWGQEPVGRDVIRTLLNKTGKVLPGSATWQVHYAFFARQGFIAAAQALAAESPGRQGLAVALATLDRGLAA